MRTVRRWFVPLVLGALLASPASAVDHNNIDAGRPLSFDDAEAIAFRERALEFGVTLSAPRGGADRLGLKAEYLVGFALNSHLSVDVDASLGGRAGSDATGADLDEVGVGVFHNFNREYGGTPAFAVRGDVLFPVGGGAGGTEYRLRGIASKAARQYDRWHLNLDAVFAPGAGDEEREFRPGAVLGYSTPLGYPTRFDRTGLAEVALQTSEEKGEGPVVSLGLGLRQQVTVRSVLDVGLRSDLAGGERDDIRLIAGYATAF